MSDTEEKIKEAAKIVFQEKGYAAARTRDIAERAGINLALLNYYFRSKEKLFEITMIQTTLDFSQTMLNVFNNPKSTLEQKIEFCVSKYIDQITKNPNIVNFMLYEVRNRPNEFIDKLHFKNLIINSVFLKQYEQAVKKGKIIEKDPINFFSNILALVIFPFIAMPILKNMSDISDSKFVKLMQQRKKLIPVWIKNMMFC
jgi:AcrR family transcriptional regulator